MFDSLIPNLLTSGARALLASLATYLISVGVLPTNGENDFVAAGVSAVLIGWSWWEKVGHTQLAATMAKVPPAVKAQAAVSAGVASSALAVALLFAGLLACGGTARAADMPLKAPTNTFTKYVNGGCGFYAGLNTMGGAGSMNGTTVPGASVIQGDVGGTVGYGCPIGTLAGSFWFAEANFDFANYNGAADGLAVTGPLHFEQKFAIGGPLSSLLNLFPSITGGLAVPSLPALPNGITTGPQYPFLFASLHEQDVSFELPAALAQGREWLLSPGIGIGLETRASNGVVLDVSAQWVLQSTGITVGPEVNKFGNAALVELTAKY